MDEAASRCVDVRATQCRRRGLSRVDPMRWRAGHPSRRRPERGTERIPAKIRQIACRPGLVASAFGSSLCDPGSNPGAASSFTFFLFSKFIGRQQFKNHLPSGCGASLNPIRFIGLDKLARSQTLENQLPYLLGHLKAW